MLKETTLYKDEDIWVTAENEEDLLPGVFVHNELLTKLTPSKMKRAKVVWNSIVNALERNNLLPIYAVPLEPDNEKWTERFGFKYTGVTLDSYKLYKYNKEDV